MRAAIIGAVVALAGLGAAAPAAALPFAGPSLQDGLVSQARIVERRVVRGPRCKTVIVKRRGPFGRTVIERRRRCF
ncbi:hypothetical protein [Methylobacterium organophilum]|uniref:Uncharacterized protein n=1 Tax=Methylobacterium organophilum TaxID=410 RepID=A0ABQ4T683_METOR|nr:hypothetical protein [Methylobacterium organophilum]GJE25597.1 hypothetical protein LKMONMHP_0435 [Methylobacterium organophilum]